MARRVLIMKSFSTLRSDDALDADGTWAAVRCHAHPFKRTLDAFKMAFTARKKVRSASTRASPARVRVVAGSVDGDSVFRHRGRGLSLPGFFRVLVRASTLERDHAGC